MRDFETPRRRRARARRADQVIGGVHWRGPARRSSFYDAIAPRRRFVSITAEYMDGGSLQDIVDTGGCRSEAVLANIAHRVLLGLSFLHRERQVHRDLKPANLLINQRGDVKISDFGVSRTLDDVAGDGPALACCDTFVGTVTYMSPERLAGDKYGAPADVWGLGVTLFTCALGRFPYDDSGGFWGLLNAMRDSEPPVLPVAPRPTTTGGRARRAARRGRRRRGRERRFSRELAASAASAWRTTPPSARAPSSCSHPFVAPASRRPRPRPAAQRRARPRPSLVEAEPTTATTT